MADKIKTLVIGGGSIGERHVRCFQSTNRTDVWLCEINEDVRNDVTKRYQLAHSFSDLQTAIQQQPDIAVICTPAHLHISMAKELAEAGIQLLIEKPVSTNFEGIDELLEVRNQRNITMGIAYVYRAHPVLAEMQAAISSGRFGKPLQVNIVSGQHFPFYRPAYRDIYYKDHATGGGAVQDALTHMVNAAEWLVGSVTRLVADADHLVLEGVTVEDSVNVIARHGDVLGSYSMNQHQTLNETTLTVICEGATVRFESQACRWQWHDQPETDWHTESSATLERDTLFVNQANAFLDAVAGEQPLLCPLEAGIQTLKVNLAILKSVAQRCWVEIE